MNLFLIILAAAETTAPEAMPASPALQTESWLATLGLLAVGLLLAFLAGWWLERFLKQRPFDPLFIPPWKPFRSRDFPDAWLPSRVLGRLVMINLGLIFCAMTLRRHQISFFTLEELLKFSGQIWLLILTTAVALAIARVITSAVISIFDNKTIRNQLELMFPHGHLPAAEQAEARPNPSARNSAALINDDGSRPAPESFADSVARIVGLTIYFIVSLPVFMIAAEIWGWSATGSTLGEVWRWLLPFTGLTVTVLIGWFALTAAVISFCPPEQRRPVMIATSVLALILLTASFNWIFALACALTLAVLAWLTRNDLPDAFAGTYLQMQRELTVKTVDGPGRVVRRELLTCDITTVNGEYRVRNRHVLRSYLDGQIIDESRMTKPVPNPHSSEN